MDLSPLDPRRDPERLERAVASILRDAAPELARRRAPQGVLGWLERWTGVGVAAAVLVAAASLATLLALPRTASTSEGIGESLGIPPSLAAWADSTGVPSTEDLLLEIGDWR
jgi:hypothetical protein